VRCDHSDTRTAHEPQALYTTQHGTKIYTVAPPPCIARDRTAWTQPAEHENFCHGIVQRRCH
jgi:hypothetical protein